jgi:hypothetical protein
MFSRSVVSISRRFIPWIVVACLLSNYAKIPAWGQKLGLQNAQFTVTLLSPISTQTSRKGDRFTARVDSPPPYRGTVLSGIITDLKEPSKGIVGIGGRKNAEIAFHFDILTVNNVPHPVTVDLTEVMNKKGIKGVDDEGHVIGKTSEAKPLVATGVGATAGAALGKITHLGSGKGAAAGAGAGLVIGLTMTTQADNIEFSPGTRFVVKVSDQERANSQ